MTSAERFKSLFDGLDSGYGQYNGLQPPDEKGKVLGAKRGWVTGPLTLTQYEQHLAGEFGLGVAPIRADSTCVFGAIDIDQYDVDHREIITKLKEASIPLIVCRSKSGGAHIYAFASEPIPAGRMTAKLREIAGLLGYGGVEIFPKQSSIIEKDGKLTASWLNLVYFGPLTNLRYAINAEGDPYELEEFLDLAERKKQPLEWFEKPLLISTEMPQGPPCLQHLIQIGFAEGTRNNGLHALGVYYKKSDPDNWAALLEVANSKYMTRLPNGETRAPVASSELSDIRKSLTRKSYNYKCQDMPLMQFCNSALCRTRKFGVGMGSAFPELGRLSKLNTDPPLWFLDVNGKKLQMTTLQLQDPHAFQTRCMEVLNIMPPLQKRDDWSGLIAKKLEEVDVYDAPEDASPAGQMWSLVEEFCTGRSQAKVRDELLVGKPWTDGGFTSFILNDLRKYLDRQRFKGLSDNQIVQVLKEHKGKSKKLRIKNLTRNVWVIPEFERQSEGLELPAALNEKAPF